MNGFTDETWRGREGFRDAVEIEDEDEEDDGGGDSDEEKVCEDEVFMAVRLRDLRCLDVEVDGRSDRRLVEKAIGGSDWISVVTGECQLGLSETESENIRQM
ncbi:hypothetical protein Tco_0916051 [Tanacetum coccineum]